MNTRGGQEGHLATTANDSVTGQILCITISWDAIKEANIEESFRPTGCAGCTIF